MKTRIFGAALALLTTQSVWAVDPSVTLTAASDYRYRGISQTAGDWAAQASFDLAFDSGLYAGVWASNVDLEDDAGIELDWYVGYNWEINDNVGLDVMLNYYSYPDYSEDGDYLELMTSLAVSDFTFLYAYTNDYFNSGAAAHYLAADYSYEIAETAGVLEALSLDAHAGWSFGDYWDEWDIGDYADLSLGVSGSWGWADLSLAYLYNNVDSSEKISSGLGRNDDTLLFTISSTFGW